MEWFGIPSTDGKYEINVDCELRNANTGRPVRWQTASNGYLYYSGGGYLHVFAHHAMMEVFVGPRPDDHDVHHKDGDKRNNSLDNLMYIDRREHRRISNRGESGGSVVLMEKDICKIRIALAEGFTGEEIANYFGVSRATISYIKSGKTWSHVECD